MGNIRKKLAIKTRIRRVRHSLAKLIDYLPPLEEPKHVPSPTYSAYGEDVLCIAYLLAQGLKYKDIRYLDVGAAEPSRLSNTYLLYTRGAKGILVEPDPDSAKVLRRERPRDKVVEVGVGLNRKKSATYYRFNFSVFNTFSKEQAKKVQRQSEDWAEGQQVELKDIRKVSLMSLNQIIEKYLDGKAPHFLSLDVEGLDWEILNTLNFKKYLPSVICFEATTGQHLTDKNMLTKLGYSPLCRTPDNMIYARNLSLL